MQLSKHVQFEVVQAALTAGTTTDSLASSTVDMSGFSGCLFLAPLGICASTVTMTARASATTVTSDFTSLTSAAAAVTTSTTSKLAFVDVYRPTKRYLRVLFNSTGANDSGPVAAIKYGAREIPTANTTGHVMASASVVCT